MSRAQVPAKTVKIGKGGVARVSPDLFVAPRILLLRFDPKTKKLRFQLHKETGLKVYKSAPGSKSGAVAMLAVLKMFGLGHTIGNTYEANVVGNELVIDFHQMVHVGNGGGVK